MDLIRWTTQKALDKLNEHLLDCRECSPQCVVCNEFLFDSEKEIIKYTDYLEYERQVIDLDMKYKVRTDIFYAYPYQSNPIICHHISYADNICVPVCHNCHGKIHGKAHQELKDLQPDMKKPLGYR